MPNRFINSGKVLTTDFQSLYVCPLDHQLSIHSLFFTNVTSTNDERYVTISIFDSSASFEYMVGKNLPVPANSTLSFDKSINLEENDVIKVKSNIDSDIHAFMSGLLVTPISI